MNFPENIQLPLFATAAVRGMDARAIEAMGGSGMILMERAGAAAFKLIQSQRPTARTLSAVAGSGNNGGDAYIVARLAVEAGWDVRVFPADSKKVLKGDAAEAQARYLKAGGAVLDFIPEDFEGAEVLVDGLFGTGLDRPVDGMDAGIIEAINRYRERGLTHHHNRRSVIALDIPSGLDADRGHILGPAVQADHTITFIQPKPGLFTGMGPSVTGTVHYSSLGIDTSLRESERPVALLSGWIEKAPTPRPRFAHKGIFGHVLILGGSPGYSGAVRLAGEAALRTGAGLVSLGTHTDHAGFLNLERPELMVHGLRTPEDLQGLMTKASVLAVGPGLGQSAWGGSIFEAALQSPLPLVLDADGLNLLADAPTTRKSWVLTPHPGEAARLLGVSNAEIQSDRLAAANRLAERFQATVILKGSGTIIAGPGQVPIILSLGNPGMATGGMGDVLTGIVAALIAQGLDLDEGAHLAALLHAAAGDFCATQTGERGLLPMDLMPILPQLLNHPALLKTPQWPRGLDG